MELTLKGKVILKGYIITETGLHIGGLSETLKIGGVDIQVIKDPEGKIIIPGSSLKGKIRSLLEKKDGQYNIKVEYYKEVEKKGKKDFEKTRTIEIYYEYDEKRESINKKMKITYENDKSNPIITDFDADKLKLDDNEVHKKVSGMPCSCGACDICKLFGPHNSKNIKESARVIVRDAFLISKDNDKILNKKDKNYENYLEIKPENVIDRVKGIAQHPRQIERVVAGSKFKFEVVFNIYKDGDKELIKKFVEGMKLLEDDYLGGSGSRGYGKIKFENMELIYKPKEYYEGNNEAIVIKENIKDVDEMYNKVEELPFK
ncbi:type III-A CRISPR-associated RAMP protein Csm3 [Methanocaldococcus sp.]|uniref:type III-A CRISPR-associated RAMP protein Csm3 n=1 Tax=Methanocaldococcus sp. TaxID=2152917 RepID=UPI002618F2D9|nr:type III-A CRISPR-associated RAMP protein Csm3 [Methanocaldococcus sp.]MCQ6253568.1 type III-A CRISPR-associated RAMP protein Csm3 [Methanocaldococcus sp.]